MLSGLYNTVAKFETPLVQVFIPFFKGAHTRDFWNYYFQQTGPPNPLFVIQCSNVDFNLLDSTKPLSFVVKGHYLEMQYMGS
jgi:hypothetical protein